MAHSRRSFIGMLAAAGAALAWPRAVTSLCPGFAARARGAVLQSRIAAARDGDVIRIGPGVYCLSSPLVISVGMTLCGSVDVNGKNRTTIRVPYGYTFVQCEGNGSPYSFSHLKFEPA